MVIHAGVLIVSQYDAATFDGVAHMRLSRLSDVDPLAVEYLLAKDDDGRMPTLERV